MSGFFYSCFYNIPYMFLIIFKGMNDICIEWLMKGLTLIGNFLWAFIALLRRKMSIDILVV